MLKRCRVGPPSRGPPGARRSRFYQHLTEGHLACVRASAARFGFAVVQADAERRSVVGAFYERAVLGVDQIDDVCLAWCEESLAPFVGTALPLDDQHPSRDRRHLTSVGPGRHVRIQRVALCGVDRPRVETEAIIALVGCPPWP